MTGPRRPSQPLSDSSEPNFSCQGIFLARTALLYEPEGLTDCQFDETADARRLKVTNIVDEFNPGLRNAIHIEPGSPWGNAHVQSFNGPLHTVVIGPSDQATL